ncbi:hypothetical protein CSKR_107219 [Clonorchis sinensis]|uniref:Uncharacterized protein n=1 Tax=Clonorchis sinensis TaxID=79923 RepID=A0A419PCJ4_CLOSI|nr:hypothetical protein CSKR_107219 [Clonorchis sinensis]
MKLSHSPLTQRSRSAFLAVIIGVQNGIEFMGYKLPQCTRQHTSAEPCRTWPPCDYEQDDKRRLTDGLRGFPDETGLFSRFSMYYSSVGNPLSVINPDCSTFARFLKVAQSICVSFIRNAFQHYEGGKPDNHQFLIKYLRIQAHALLIPRIRTNADIMRYCSVRCSSNQSFRGILRTTRKQVVIHFVYKGAPHYDSSSYHPINLTKEPGRVMEKTTNRTASSYLFSNTRLHPTQHAVIPLTLDAQSRTGVWSIFIGFHKASGHRLSTYRSIPFGMRLSKRNSARPKDLWQRYYSARVAHLLRERCFSQNYLAYPSIANPMFPPDLANVSVKLPLKCRGVFYICLYKLVFINKAVPLAALSALICTVESQPRPQTFRTHPPNLGAQFFSSLHRSDSEPARTRTAPACALEQLSTDVR